MKDAFVSDNDRIKTQPLTPVLKGLKDKVLKARYLHDRTEANSTPPWMVGSMTEDAYIVLPPNISDELDLVVKVYLK